MERRVERRLETVNVTNAELPKVAEILGSRAERNVSLASFTTFRIGGSADFVVRPSTVIELVDVAKSLAAVEVDFLVLGQGSNVLVSDQGFRGVVIIVEGEFGEWSVDGDVVTSGSAVKMPVLSRQCAQRGLAGLEWMVGVPGSIGGAVCMNAGGHGADVAANLVSARVLNLRNGIISEHTNNSLQFGYRRSAIVPGEMVLSASFQCHRGDRDELEAEISSIVRWRREHQPGGANCGSVFTNPVGDSAGRLIDVAGLKGLRRGAAEVSSKHANFIQAGENASSNDVWELIIEVRRRVFEGFGVVLHPEVRTIGFDAMLPQLPALAPLNASETPETTETSSFEEPEK
jgi:UDP-N-acetylmuramate dehydrogenase